MTALRLLALCACALAAPVFAATPAAEKLPIWPQGVPGAAANGGEETVRVTEQGDTVVSNIHNPSLTIYLPKKNPSGAAVVILPGGGHRELWSTHEGHNVAKFLSSQGVAAFVLFYRLERAPDSPYKIEEHALADTQQALRLVRSRAKDWGVNTAKVGIMGFSAGGQLALLGAMRVNEVNGISSRPDFVALVYPGSWPEIKLDASSPPMFLLSGSDDRPGVLNTLTQVFTQLREAKVPAELHFYDGVPHGFGLRASLTGPVANWPTEFVDWLKVRKVL